MSKVDPRFNVAGLDNFQLTSPKPRRCQQARPKTRPKTRRAAKLRPPPEPMTWAQIAVELGISEKEVARTWERICLKMEPVIRDTNDNEKFLIGKAMAQFLKKQTGLGLLEPPR